ncbi:CGNR zinc finger domain-containing protein [Leifsonia sp. A12D58]|uniref:CGNR zinc finger domain-containing protein n=1 Tax=Leifsonia sp. A12D58 TaxID=3397674 RepID=UPI0039E1C077
MSDRRDTGQTGQWLDSDGQQWWFDSGSVALDFAYSGSMGDTPAWEKLHTADDLAGWLNERFTVAAPEAGATASTSAPGVGSPAAAMSATDRDLLDAKALRDAIASLTNAAAARASLNTRDIDVLNLFAATPDIPPSLGGGSRQAGRTAPRAGQALSTLARTAIELFEPTEIERIRECSADDCGIIYLDTSRSANRRWCSMQRCGNRAKIRAYRERLAQQDSEPAAR